MKLNKTDIAILNAIHLYPSAVAKTDAITSFNLQRISNIASPAYERSIARLLSFGLIIDVSNHVKIQRYKYYLRADIDFIVNKKLNK
jgi:hypothetical protein